MKRICFLLRVKADLVEDYKKAHEPVWPEMLQAMREAGIRNYSIFLTEDGLLINYLEAEDTEESFRKCAATEASRRWQEYMSPYLEPDSLIQVEQTFFME